MSELSLIDAKEFISYDFVSGVASFVQRDRKWFSSEKDWKSWNTRFAGKTIEGKDSRGYIQVRVLSERLKLHRLIWLYMTGEWPKGDIDHINGNKADNRWENLREVSHQENMKNKSQYKTNTSGTSGVNWRKDHKKWQACISTPESKWKSLGFFDTKEEAIAARKAAEIEYNYHENHGKIR